MLSNSNLVDLERLVILGDKITSSSILNQSSSEMRVCSSENDCSVHIRMFIHHALELILSFLSCSKSDSLARFGGQS